MAAASTSLVVAADTPAFCVPRTVRSPPTPTRPPITPAVELAVSELTLTTPPSARPAPAVDPPTVAELATADVSAADTVMSPFTRAS